MPVVSYGRALTDQAARDPDAIALIHEGDSFTRGALERRANQRARALAAGGVAPGDFVTLALPNGAAFVESLFACWKLGATPQPISPRLPRQERDAIVELVDPRVVVGEAHVAAGRTALPADPDLDAFAADPLPDRVAKHRMAICSGGSTGRPKVVVDHIGGAARSGGSRSTGSAAGDEHPGPGPALPFRAALINCMTRPARWRQGRGHESLRCAGSARPDRLEHRLALAIFVPTMLLRIWKLPAKPRARPPTCRR